MATIRSYSRKIVIDNPDAYIGNYAFYNFSSVINLEINNCGDIGKYTFQNCLKLENVTIKIVVTLAVMHLEILCIYPVGV